MKIQKYKNKIREYKNTKLEKMQKLQKIRKMQKLQKIQMIIDTDDHRLTDRRPTIKQIRGVF